MQPRSHALIIRLGVEQAGVALFRERIGDLLRGNDDEDAWRVPILGVRVPAPGATHSCRPGRRRGELFLPSARDRCARSFRRAEEAMAGDPGRACRLLGRCCHLLGDAAVPARARGVWHLLRDPFERWAEAHVEALGDLPPAPIPEERDPAALVESLARAAAKFPADTTRTPWGWCLGTLGRAVRVDALEAERQARALLPLAAAHTAALLSLFHRTTRVARGTG